MITPQQKSANLIDIVQLDTRNLSTETEKEMEILGSRNLLGRLAENLQLNARYGSKGYIKWGQNYKNLPFTLKLDEPDSISEPIQGDVQIVNDKIKFDKKNFLVILFYYPILEVRDGILIEEIS